MRSIAGSTQPERSLSPLQRQSAEAGFLEVCAALTPWLMLPTFDHYKHTSSAGLPSQQHQCAAPADPAQ